MPREVIDAWDYFYHKQKMRRDKKIKVVKRKMKKGDKVTLLVHGDGVTSEEDGYIIDEMDDKALILEDYDKIFYRDKNKRYKTEREAFGFWFEIKGE